MPEYFNQTTYISLLNYEMIEPFDSFGKTMVNNLIDRGCDLYGIEGCPNISAQIQRMESCWQGKQNKIECISMEKIYA